MSQRLLYPLVIATSLAVFSDVAYGQWDTSGSISNELRIFPYKPAFPEQDNASASASVALAPEFVYEWGSDKNRLTFTPFARWDSNDDNRTHLDLREANWLHIGPDYDMVVGVSKVFWGVTESRHLVDIINQVDGVEDIDNEDKLGQPMINFNLIRAWGTLRTFVLPGFREHTFPDDNARLRGPLPIDVNHPTYESGAKEHHVDAALRWTHTVGQLGIGLAHFRGTGREPRLLPAVRDGRTVFVPQYDQINQTSLDMQLTAESTLWKLEAITRSGQGKRFFAAVSGLEYTFYGIFESKTDLGVLVEYLYDGRDNATAPASFIDKDVFIGVRLVLNDTQDTTFLAGTIVDRNARAIFLNVEAERRLGEHWKLEIKGRFFNNVPDNNPLAGIRRDDFISLRLGRYFK